MALLRLLPLLALLALHLPSALAQWTAAINPDTKGTRLDFQIEPTDVVAKSGQVIQLTCQVFGRTPTKTRWYHVGSSRRLRDSGEITGTKHSTLRLSNVSQANAGSYYCTVLALHFNGTIRSRSARVKVVVPSGKLMISPKANTWSVKSGGQSVVAVFHCKHAVSSVTDAARPTITWEHNSVSTLAKWVPINGTARHYQAKYVILPSAQSSTLQLLRPSQNDLHSLIRCQSEGSVSETARFHVVGKTMKEISSDPFSQRPHDAQALVGDNIVIPCATMHPYERITWFKAAEPIRTFLAENGTVAPDHSDLSVVGGGNLLFSRVSMHSAGTYICAIRTASGTRYAQANLTVFEPPRLVNEHGRYVHKDYAVGVKMQLACLFEAWPEATIRWLKNGKPLTSSKYIVNVTVTRPTLSPAGAVQSNPLTPAAQTQGSGTVRQLSTLTIGEMAAGDAGSYQCVAESARGMAHGIFRVEVEFPAYIVKQPEAQLSVSQNGNFSLACQVRAYPIETLLTWYRDDVATDGLTMVITNGPSLKVLSTGDKRRYSLSADGTFNVINARHADHGSYYCVVKNNIQGFEGVISETSVVTVTGTLEKATIDASRMPAQVELQVGRQLQLHCPVRGFPEPQVGWVFFENLPCPSLATIAKDLRTWRRRKSFSLTEKIRRMYGLKPLDGRFRIGYDDNGAGLLTVPYVGSTAYTGRYVCIANNSLGYAVQCVNVNITDPPVIIDPPLHFNDAVFPKLPKAIKQACSAGGSPIPLVHWSWVFTLINGSKLAYRSRRVHQQQDSNIIIGENVAILNMTCHGENSYGKAERELFFTFRNLITTTRPVPTTSATIKPATEHDHGHHHGTPNHSGPPWEDVSTTKLHDPSVPGSSSPTEPSPATTAGDIDLGAQPVADTPVMSKEIQIYVGLTIGCALVLIVLLAAILYIWRQGKTNQVVDPRQSGLQEEPLTTSESCSPPPLPPKPTSQRQRHVSESSFDGSIASHHPSGTLRSQQMRLADNASFCRDMETPISPMHTQLFFGDVGFRSPSAGGRCMTRTGSLLSRRSQTSDFSNTSCDPLSMEPNAIYGVPLPLSPVFSTNSSQAKDPLSPHDLEFSDVVNHLELELGQRTISHKRTSYFDFTSSKNRIPGGADENQLLAHVFHAQQPSSSWGGVASPLTKEARDGHDDGYEIMHPQHGLVHRAEMLQLKGKVMVLSPPPVSRTCCGSCPNLPAEVQQPSTTQPEADPSTSQSSNDSGQESSEGVAVWHACPQKLEFVAAAGLSDDFSPAYIEHSGSESDVQLGSTGYLENASSLVLASGDAGLAAAGLDIDDLPVFSSDNSSIDNSLASLAYIPGVDDVEEEEAVKELDVMMASLSDLLSGLDSCSEGDQDDDSDRNDQEDA